MRGEQQLFRSSIVLDRAHRDVSIKFHIRALRLTKRGLIPEILTVRESSYISYKKSISKSEI